MGNTARGFTLIEVLIVLCLVGLHRWVRVAVLAPPPFPGAPPLVSDVCDRPWCRGRTERKRWTW